MNKSKIPDNVINKDLYLQAKQKADETYKKPSAYKSAFIQKEYMRLGGEYTKKTHGLKRWFDEQWVQVVPYLEENKKIECGSDNKKNKACRPLKKINKDSPETIDNLVEKLGKDKVLELAKEKNNNMDKRINWEEGKIYGSGLKEDLKKQIQESSKDSYFLEPDDNYLLMSMYNILLNNKNSCHLIYKNRLYKLEINNWKDTDISSDVLKKLFKKFDECKKNNKVLVIPLLMQIENEGHCNMIIFNTYRDEIERFEPQGSEFLSESKTIDKIFENLAKKFSEHYNKEFKYIPPIDYCPKKIFQSVEKYVQKKENINYNIKEKGYCVSWAHWYADLRIKYPKESSKDIIDKTLKILKQDPIELRRFIRGQSKKVYDLYHQVLNNLNIDPKKYFSKINPEVIDKKFEELNKNFSKFVEDKSKKLNTKLQDKLKKFMSLTDEKKKEQELKNLKESNNNESKKLYKVINSIDKEFEKVQEEAANIEDNKDYDKVEKYINNLLITFENNQPKLLKDTKENRDKVEEEQEEEIFNKKYLKISEEYYDDNNNKLIFTYHDKINNIYIELSKEFGDADYIKPYLYIEYLYSKYDKNKPRAKKGLTRFLLCDLIKYLMTIKKYNINKNTYLYLTAGDINDEIHDLDKLKKMYLDMGFIPDPKRANVFTQKISEFLKWCNKSKEIKNEDDEKIEIIKHVTIKKPKKEPKKKKIRDEEEEDEFFIPKLKLKKKKESKEEKVKKEKIKKEKVKKEVKPKTKEIINLSDKVENLMSNDVKKYQLVAYLEDKHPEVDKKLLKKPKKNIVKWFDDNYSPQQIDNLIENDVFNKYGSPYKAVKFEQKLEIPKLKKDQKTEQEEKAIERRLLDYTKGEIPIGNLKNEIINLQPHQKNFIEGFLLANLRCAIAFHGVGTGKTLTAVSCSRLYLQLFPNHQVVIITPSAVLTQFIVSMASFGIDPRDTRYKYFSYDKFARNKSTFNNALVIVDEAHNFRTPMTIKELNNGNIKFSTDTKNKRGIQILQRAGLPVGNKILLLTATPFVNRPYDIENLLAIGEGRMPTDEKTFGDIASNKDMRKDYFRFTVSHYEKSHNNEYFPERREKIIAFEAPESDNEIKAIVSRSKNNFYLDSRQAGLKYENKKFKFIIDIIKKNPTKKYVVYSTFRESGIDALEKIFNKKDITYSRITGSETTLEKENEKDKFNNFDDPNWKGQKVQVLLISRAGAEGVDLKRTRGIFVLDGQWNDALYEQIVARAIRYKSHWDLPKKEQFVEVYLLMVVYPSEIDMIKKVNNGQAIDFSKIYAEVVAYRTDLKKKLKDTKLKGYSFLPEDEVENDFEDDYDPEEIEKLKKGSKEKLEALESQEYAKGRESYDVQKIIKHIPSTDWYLFVLQKVKQAVIDRFIKDIDSTVEPLEKSIMNLPQHKELWNEMIKDNIDYSDFLKWYIAYYQPKLNIAGEKISNNIKKDKTRLQKFLEKRSEVSDKQKKLAEWRVNQEFFTPQYQVDKLIKLSLIRDTKDKTFTLNILEPTAGYGDIISGLLDVMKFNKIPLKIDMVEISKENREKLYDLQKDIPDVLQLQSEPNFLNFIPSGRYDYIFMNPPFHLTKKNTGFSRDYYDIDFIKRAWAMLDDGGRLVSIVGDRYWKQPNFKKWLNDHDAEIKSESVEWKGVEKGSLDSNLKIAYIRMFKKYTTQNIEEIKAEENELLKPLEFTDKDERRTKKQAKIMAEIPQIEYPSEFSLPVAKKEKKPKENNKKIKDNKQKIKELEDKAEKLILDGISKVQDDIFEYGFILNDNDIEAIKQEVSETKEFQNIKNEIKKIKAEDKDIEDIQNIIPKHRIKGYWRYN